MSIVVEELGRHGVHDASRAAAGRKEEEERAARAGRKRGYGDRVNIVTEHKNEWDSDLTALSTGSPWICDTVNT